jgi:hypothetical protein
VGTRWREQHLPAHRGPRGPACPAHSEALCPHQGHPQRTAPVHVPALDPSPKSGAVLVTVAERMTQLSPTPQRCPLLTSRQRLLSGATHFTFTPFCRRGVHPDCPRWVSCFSWRNMCCPFAQGARRSVRVSWSGNGVQRGRTSRVPAGLTCSSRSRTDGLSALLASRSPKQLPDGEQQLHADHVRVNT